MRSRQRGAAWLLGLLVAGRLLDRFDLPFERRSGAESRAGAGASGVASTSPLADAPRPAAPSPVVQADSAPARRPGAPVDSTPVAINRAGAADLQRLPGVGPVLAARILAHRQAHGPFRSLADLVAVRGIGPRTAARLAPRVRFD